MNREPITVRLCGTPLRDVEAMWIESMVTENERERRIYELERDYARDLELNPYEAEPDIEFVETEIMQDWRP